MADYPVAQWVKRWPTDLADPGPDMTEILLRKDVKAQVIHPPRSVAIFKKDRHIRPRGYKTFFMLISTKHEMLPAHKC